MHSPKVGGIKSMLSNWNPIFPFLIVVLIERCSTLRKFQGKHGFKLMQSSLSEPAAGPVFKIVDLVYYLSSHSNIDVFILLFVN